MNTASQIGNPLHPEAGSAGRRRRRWWVYALWSVGVLVVLFLLLLFSAGLYFNHLIRTYTSAQPVPLPKVENLEERWAELKARWQPYAVQFVRGGEIPPIEFSADELNVAVNMAGPMRNHSHLELMDGKLRVRFSAPLGGGNNEKLQGRYLNGVAILKPTLEKGHIRARIESVEANGKPIPKWILKRVQQQNWAGRMNYRPETDIVIRGTERMEVTPTAVTLYPIQGKVNR